MPREKALMLLDWSRDDAMRQEAAEIFRQLKLPFFLARMDNP